MQSGMIGQAPCVMEMLENLNAREWSLGAGNECVWWRSPALALSERVFRKMLKTDVHRVVASF